MRGEEQQKGNVLIVGIKPEYNGGQELITWTLAKFTNAGDHVIALHVTPSLDQADAIRSNQEREGVFDSIMGVYESFCSMKQVDLQVKVVNGSSLRRALIEEVKKNHAAKLILGASAKPHLGSSFSLAKYCSRRLPMTCTVVVIQHGQVTFAKEGGLKNLGDSSGVLYTIQRTLRSHSWKGPGHHHMMNDRSACIQPEEVDGGQDNYENASCHWPLPVRFLDSPVSVLQSYKPQMLSLQERSANVELRASSFTHSSIPEDKEGTNTSSLDDATKDREKRTHSQVTLRYCLALNIGDQKNDISENKSDKEGLALPSSNLDAETCSPVKLVKITEDTRGEVDAVNDETLPSVGWPLLHRSILTSELKHRSERVHKMSVVEWALQLPDRPKDIQADQDVQHDFTPLVSSEGMCGENSSTPSGCTSHASPQSHADSVASRIARLSLKNSCKEFPFVELKAATNSFSMDNMVGKGGCSQVYQGVFADGSIVAVKRLNASALDSEDAFLTEIEITCGLDHNHIVQLIGYCVDTQHYLLVYNFASGGNLEQKLHGGKGKTALPWESRYNIAVGVAEALKYLHDGCTRPVIHRDVKSSNILLSSDLEPQLTDFGLAKWASTTSTQITCSDVVGTFGYLAPEYFMFGKVSEKTDVYSFGVVLLELITGRHPINNTRPKGEENLVIWARPLLEDESSTDQLIDPKLEAVYDTGQLKNMMIAAALCLRQAPQMRPRMSRILKLLTGEAEDLDHLGRQDSVCKESDDGYDMPNYGDTDIRTHLMLALLGLDDDAASQGSIEHSVNLAHSNKYLEEYLGGRYSRSSSFE